MKTKTLWLILTGVVIASFSVLGFYGREIYQEKPPIPDKVVSIDGTVLFTAQDIQEGQNVWQSIGGQQVGSIWGHGAYVAPDWSADWLHKEAVFLLDKWSMEDNNMLYEDLDLEKQASLKARLQERLRANTYDSATGILTVSLDRAEAIQVISAHYTGLFMNDPSLDAERAAYAIPANSIKDVNRMDKMNAFFFWAEWACVTQRPNSSITYTNNWPPDDTVGNTPTAGMSLWTGVSVIMLLIGVSLLAFYHAHNHARNKSSEIDKSLLDRKSVV